MKRKRYTDEQIAFALRQVESGMAVEELCRKLGVSEATFYRWKKQFAGMGVVEIRRLKQLEEENAKLKRSGRRSVASCRAATASPPRFRSEPMQRWSLDFISDQLADCRRFP